MSDKIVFKKKGSRNISSRKKEPSPEVEVRQQEVEEIEDPTTSKPSALSYKDKLKAKRNKRSGIDDSNTTNSDNAKKQTSVSLSQSISNKLKNDQGKRKDEIEISVTDDMDNGEDDNGLSGIAKRIYGNVSTKKNDNDIIPSQMSIDLAKKKRMESVNKDYISLSDDNVNDRGLVIKHDEGIESRFQREEDDDFDDIEGDDDSIKLTNKDQSDRMRQLRKQRGEIIDEVMEDYEEDEEQKKWESYQVKRSQLYRDNGDNDENENYKKVYVPAQIPQLRPLSNLNKGLNDLSSNIQFLENEHQQKRLNYDYVLNELKTLQNDEDDLKKQVVGIDNRRMFFENFKLWCDDIANFLDDKMPKLEKLENDHYELMIKRTNIINERRSKVNDNDIEIDLDESEKEDYVNAKKSIMIEKENIMKDVKVKDYIDPSKKIDEMFRSWRNDYGDYYVRGWGPLVMVYLWEFWTRYEMLGWEPFKEIDKDVVSLLSYQSIHDYVVKSRDENEQENAMMDEEEEEKEKMENECIAELIGSIIIPRMIEIIKKGGYDGKSIKERRRGVEILEMLESGMENMQIDKLNVRFLSKTI